MCEADQGSPSLQSPWYGGSSCEFCESTRGRSRVPFDLQISLGGAIGTGLYLGIANALATGGPVSMRASREGCVSFFRY